MKRKRVRGKLGKQSRSRRPARTRKLLRKTKSRKSSKRISAKKFLRKIKVAKKRTTTVKRVKKLRAGTTTVRVDVYSRQRQKDLTVRRKIFNFKPARKMTDENIEILKSKAMKFYNDLGKSYKNLWLIKILYTFKLGKRNYESAFSLVITSVRTAEQFANHLDNTFDAFFVKLTEYISAVFLFRGIQVQNYEG